MVAAGALFTNKSPGLAFSKANNTNSTASSRDIKTESYSDQLWLMVHCFQFALK